LLPLLSRPTTNPMIAAPNASDQHDQSLSCDRGGVELGADG